MNTTMKRVLFWTPRVLCILFAMFLSLFALDVFSEGYGLWQTIGALLIPLGPDRSSWLSRQSLHGGGSGLGRSCSALWQCSMWSGLGDAFLWSPTYPFPAPCLARYSFSVQLDIQSTAANAIVAA